MKKLVGIKTAGERRKINVKLRKTRHGFTTGDSGCHKPVFHLNLRLPAHNLCPLLYYEFAIFLLSVLHFALKTRKIMACDALILFLLHAYTLANGFEKRDACLGMVYAAASDGVGSHSVGTINQSYEKVRRKSADHSLPCFFLPLVTGHLPAFAWRSIFFP